MAHQVLLVDRGIPIVGKTQPLPRRLMKFEHQAYLELLAGAVLDPVGIGGLGWGDKGDSEWTTSTFQARKPSSDDEIRRSGWTPTKDANE